MIHTLTHQFGGICVKKKKKGARMPKTPVKRQDGETEPGSVAGGRVVVVKR